MKFIHVLNPFRKPSPEMMATQELEDARRALLEAQTGMEYAKAMVSYRTEQIERLTKIVGKNAQ